MLKNNNILIAKNDTEEINLLLNKANRHGLITGASGSGKTITLKVLAESFSDAGVPVFVSDIKGDLAGMIKAGENSESINKRIDKLKLEDFNLKSFPTTFFDVYGEAGHPIRTTISDIGYKLLSRMLNLTDAQEGVLAIIFKISEDEKKELIDLQDLRAMLSYVGENRDKYTLNYGTVTSVSIGGIQRSILELEAEGGTNFFGKPSLDINDLFHFDTNGMGTINILHAVKLFQQPTLYTSFLLWILTKLYNTMPEVGDLDKPKLVFFFDEAHLIFEEMPEHLIKSVIQIVKLIRSKGIGLYFISQSPGDIPDEILAQLGNRIQHVLRCYTKTDEKVIKAAANSYRSNPEFDTETVIKELGTGEALISVQNENGEPSIVKRAFILPPQSMMGAIDDQERSAYIKNSWLYNKYENVVNDISAYEKINGNTDVYKPEEKPQSTLGKPMIEKNYTTPGSVNIPQNFGIPTKSTVVEPVKETKKTTTKTSGYKRQTAGEKMVNAAASSVGRKLGSKLFDKLFK